MDEDLDEAVLEQERIHVVSERQLGRRLHLLNDINLLLYF